MAVTAININFLSQRRLEVQQAQAFDKKIFKGVLIVFLVSFSLAGGLFAYWRYQLYRLDQISEDQEQQVRIITQAAEDEAYYLLYTTRLDLIGSIFEVRSSKRRAMEFLAQLVQPSITFDQVTYDSETRELKYRVSATDVFAVEQYLERLRSQNLLREIEELGVGSVARDEFGGYSLDTTVKLVAEEMEGGQQ